jgi:6-phosphogluconolactonase
LGLDQVLCYRLNSKTAELSPNEPAIAKTAPGAGPRHLTFHPGGKYVYVLNELDNTVAVFAYDGESGALQELQVISTLPEGYEGESYTADLKITPDGQFLYSTNRGHDSIAIYRINDEGRLSLLEFTPSLGEGPQNLVITPGGELLLCANMPGNNVVVFRIDSETGQLSTVGEPYHVIKPSCIKIL